MRAVVIADRFGFTSSQKRPRNLCHALLTCVREANLGRATASTRILGATNTRPRSDTVAGRLDVFRERLKQRFPFFEGLAFTHQ